MISMGSCANSGGMYDIYSVVQGVDKFLPVDVYVPGCPPRPEAFLEGLLLLQKAVGTEAAAAELGGGFPRDDSGAATVHARLDAAVAAESPCAEGAGRRMIARPDHHAGNHATGSVTAAVPQETHDHIPTFWVDRDRVPALLRFLKEEIDRPYKMLYDLTAIDERMKAHRDGTPASDFTVVYHLFSFDRNEYLRIKVALAEDQVSLPSITGIWPAANWYEREVWDMFGIVFDGHPHLEAHPDAARPGSATRCAKNIRLARRRWGHISCRTRKKWPSRRRSASVRRNGA